DGGKNWERVLFVDENTGCADIVADPSNPRIVFAGMWQFEIKTWGRFSGGPGSGLFRSSDGGATWTTVTGNGLPVHQVGKFGLAIARSNPNRIYALIETSDGVPWKGDEADRGKLWRSDDGGRTWQLINYDRNLGGRTHYYFRMVVSPDNENETYYLNASYSVSLDGGRTSSPQPFNASPGGGGRGGNIPRSMWSNVGGGESGFATPDPVDPTLVWSTASGSGSVGGIVVRHNTKTGMSRNVEIWPDSPLGWPPADIKYRFNW